MGNGTWDSKRNRKKCVEFFMLASGGAAEAPKAPPPPGSATAGGGKGAARVNNAYQVDKIRKLLDIGNTAKTDSIKFEENERKSLYAFLRRVYFDL